MNTSLPVKIILSFVLSVAIALGIVLTIRDIGLAWDEPTYMQHGDVYFEWFKHPSFTTIDTYWKMADIHPPLRKIVSSASSLLFSQITHTTGSSILGYRLSTLLFILPMAFLFSLFMYRWGVMASIFSVVGLFLLPHFFYHAHLITLDVAVSAFWLISIVITTSTKISHQLKIFFLSIILSAATLTKFSGIFLFVPVGLWLFWCHWTDHKKSAFRSYLQPILFTIRDMSILSGATIILFFAYWPFLWTAPLPHIFEFITVQLGHLGIPVYYLGHVYYQAPWHYPFVLFFITTPLSILILFCIGMVLISIRGTALERFILFNALFPMAIVALPQSPKYDSVRQFLPAFPFVMAVAAIGLSKAVTVVKSVKLQKYIVLFISLGCLVETAGALIRIYPYPYTYYNTLIGGLRGAKKYGFEIEYWGSSFQNILPYMNANKSKTFCSHPFNDVFVVYAQNHLLSPDIQVDTERKNCELFLLLNREGYLHTDEIESIQSTKPLVQTVSLDGIPLVFVYRLK
jgi:4-amino-4-deoxy-L-arabinose transferase-like glycosyltransferase